MPRPREDKATALLNALAAFVSEGQKPTQQELAHRALVSQRDTRSTLSNLVRAGHVEVKGERRVHYRNKPVAVYGFPDGNGSEAPLQTLVQALSVWR